MNKNATLGKTVGSLALLSFLILGSGCASAKLSTSKAVTAPPSQVSVVISDKTAKAMKPEELDGFKVLIINRLQQQNIRAVSAENKTVPCLGGEVTTFDPGNRALRYWVGMGAGKGTLKSSWSLKDENGLILGSCEIDGDIRGGTFGGNFSEVSEKTGEKLVRFLQGKTE